MLATLLLAAATVAAPVSDPKAVAIADQVMEAMGGEAAWRATCFLRFDFAVDALGKTVSTRSHWWDKWRGRYRVEGKTKEGEAYTVLMNVNTKDGSAWQGGKPLEGEAKKKLLEKGYGAWVNDTYWLIMPYKLRDAGVVLKLEGELTEKDKTWDQPRAQLREGRPHTEGPLLGLCEPHDPPRRPLGVHPAGREPEGPRLPLPLEQLAALREDPALTGEGEREGQGEDLLPEAGGLGHDARRRLHFAGSGAVARNHSLAAARSTLPPLRITPTRLPATGTLPR